MENGSGGISSTLICLVISIVVGYLDIFCAYRSLTYRFIQKITCVCVNIGWIYCIHFNEFVHLITKKR